MHVIGLTGNIACGKSTVAAMLAELGAQVIDADEIVHRLQEPGGEVYRRIVQEFGPSVLRPDGRVDRRKLGEVVFADRAALARLEAMTHPAVIEEVERLLGASRASVVVVEAVKLVESGLHRHCDSLWVVVCKPEAQARRLRDRGMDEAAIAARLAAQPEVEGKLRLADVVVDDSGELASTRRQVAAAWKRLGLPS